MNFTASRQFCLVDVQVKYFKSYIEGLTVFEGNSCRFSTFIRGKCGYYFLYQGRGLAFLFPASALAKVLIIEQTYKIEFVLNFYELKSMQVNDVYAQLL